jgi:TPR repeat protein
MAGKFRVKLAAAALLLGFTAGLAAAQGPPAVKTDMFPALFEKIRNDADLQELWSACPADIYRTKAAFWVGQIDSSDIDVSECEADPFACHRACFQGLNENACFSLALALQRNAEEKFSRYWEAMFARACAAGHDGGCTNRGAGIRNGLYNDDPFTARSEIARNSCLFRTFQTSCRAGDAWGCTMHAQSYQYGEGVPVDRDKAAEFYRKACDIHPDFDACYYAEEQLQKLGIAPKTE